jgi:hypothetical protein
MAEPTDEDFRLARQRGEESLRNEPHAAAVRYDAKSGRLIIDLTNGCTFAVPANLLQHVRDLPPEEIAKVRLMEKSGMALEWEEADIHFSVAGLVSGFFGNRRYMDQLWASRAGSVTSPAKAAAARANGAKGGRPRKSA